jgi:hypothetical protein
MSGLRSVALQFVVFFFVGWSAAAIGIVPSLPTLELSTSQDVSSETKIPCTVRWVPSPTGVDRTANTKLLNGKVRIHGASSQSYEKKSLALSLDSPTRWLGLTSGRQWVLNAAYVDCSLMRHKLSYDLFQSLSSDGVKRHASSSGFVELRFNGQYHGTYLLMERVEGSLLGFTPKGQPSKVPAVLYKAIDHEANFGNPGHSGYEQREPSPEDQEYWGPLDDLNQFVATAKDADFALGTPSPRLIQFPGSSLCRGITTRHLAETGRARPSSQHSGFPTTCLTVFSATKCFGGNTWIAGKPCDGANFQSKRCIE